MKKIDLTFRTHRTIKHNSKTGLPQITWKELAMIARNQGHLLYDVVEALVNYKGGVIEDANDTLALADRLKANPIATISDDEFALIENALMSATVEVKAAWANMVKQLN